LDDRYMKLNAGPRSLQPEPDRYRAPGDLDPLVDGLRQLQDVTIRSVFAIDRVHHIDNSTDDAVEPWLQMIDAIWPRAVHVCTLEGQVASPSLEKGSARRPAWVCRSRPRLDERNDAA
jgi:hypothetical protein